MLGKFQFGLYELDRDAMELRKHGVTVRLQEQPLRVLAALVERPGEIVTREELQARIWGKDTFVDFEQSLNKAVNRLREALNDQAGQPKYVETVPRRGYRFIAAVSGLNATEPPPRPPVLPSPVSDAVPASSEPRKARIGIIAVLATGTLLVAVGITAGLLWKRPEKSTPAETKHITSAAFCCPTVSRDGKLLAYVSNAGGGLMHIWVQQTAGGEAIQVSRGSEGEFQPDFSPDGTHIAFASGNGSIYIAPTLSGEPKLLAKAHYGGAPRFSPDGQEILYSEGGTNAHLGNGTDVTTVSIDSGARISLNINRDFLIHGPTLWSPNGDKIIFFGVNRQEPSQPDEWWIVSLTTGKAKSVRLPGADEDATGIAAARAWVRGKDGGEWIIYSVSDDEVWRLFRIRVSAQDQIDGKPEQLTSGTGHLGSGGSVSEDGKLVYPIMSFTDSIYEIPTDSRGQKSGPTVQLPLPEAGDYRSPFVSRDGRWMAYDSSIPGKSNIIVLRDLSSGAEHFLDQTGRRPGEGGQTTISPDGSKVIFNRDCGRRLSGDPLLCGFMIPATGGEPEQVCESCTARGFSSDGSVVLIQKYNRTADNNPPNRITALDLTSRTEKEFISTPDKSVYHPFFSWDDRWVAFKKVLQEPVKSQIVIAPVRDGAAGKEPDWIAITDGSHNDDKPQFSPDGNTVYFTSTRDGFFCIWVQRLDPATKRPVGDPIGYEHFHNSAGRDAASYPFIDKYLDLSVARDKILINLPQFRADIWMMQIR
jgi:Tol biopolymer transport system component/DNA-binding winged helix-turn-helix (wHTH) protein